MLKIWYCGGCDFMKNAPKYFDNVWEEEWLEDEFVKEMILDVDKSKVIGPHLIESPVLGPIPPTYLSGGVKVLILMLKDDSFIYNLSNCGDNCAKWVLKIAEKKDLVVFLHHIMEFEEEFEIMIMNTGNIVHTKLEYVTELFRAEDLVEKGVISAPNWYK